MSLTASFVGDQLIADPHFSTDQSAVLPCPPDAVWPWLAQMGFGRAGWYSWDWIDNLGRRSATELHADWMIEKAGDLMPAGPISFDTPIVARPHQLVLATLDRRIGPWTIDFTLAYDLTETSDRTTRLATRARSRINGPLGPQFARHVLRPGDAMMVRKQLRGIAARVT